MAVNVEDIDWIDAILTYGGNTPEAFIDRLDDEKWILRSLSALPPATGWMVAR